MIDVVVAPSNPTIPIIVTIVLFTGIVLFIRYAKKKEDLKKKVRGNEYIFKI